MSTVTNTQVELDHPYRVAGVLMILVSFVVLAFSLGVLNRCGGGSGVCFDTSTHATGDAGLLLFIVLLILGAALAVYTGATAYTTRTRTPDPVAPAVTNVISQPAAAPTPVTNVYPQAAAPPATVVVTPRG